MSLAQHQHIDQQWAFSMFIRNEINGTSLIPLNRNSAQNKETRQIREKDRPFSPNGGIEYFSTHRPCSPRIASPIVRKQQIILVSQIFPYGKRFSVVIPEFDSFKRIAFVEEKNRDIVTIVLIYNHDLSMIYFLPSIKFVLIYMIYR